jgi:hypothetical protein
MQKKDIQSHSRSGQSDLIPAGEPPDKLQALLTPYQTAGLLGVTVGTLSVWRSVHRYPLTYIKVGGRVMYRSRDVNQFITSRAVNPSPTDAPD